MNKTKGFLCNPEPSQILRHFNNTGHVITTKNKLRVQLCFAFLHFFFFLHFEILAVVAFDLTVENS